MILNDATSNRPEVARPRFSDRWKRFSLRTLFLLMTLSCLVLGLWSVYVNPYRQQLQSLAAVIRLQGTAGQVDAAGPVWQRWLVTTLLGEKAFVHVTEVDLQNRQVDDQAMRSLSGLIHLETLSLDNTPITDAGLASLSPLRNLKTLHLRYTKITDRAATTLASFPKLETVYLTGTPLTDAAIDALAKRDTMKTIFIRWTKITTQGATRLATALPHCAVHHHALIADAATAGP